MQPKQISNQEFIEVLKSVPNTILCLREQSGSSRHMTTNDDMRVFFDCSKRGMITVETNIVGYFSGDVNIFPIYHTYGKVVEIAGKTYVRIVSVYKKTDIIWC